MNWIKHHTGPICLALLLLAFAGFIGFVIYVERTDVTEFTFAD